MDTNGNSFVERYLTPIAVLLGALILALAYVYGHNAITNNGGTTGTGTTPAAVDIKNVKTDGEPYIGDPNAPVTMAFFFDYQCPFCKQFEQTVSPEIYKDYVQTGKLKIVFKGFEFLGNDSITADEFGRAVWELYPDQFYAWYTAMFNAQDQEGDTGFGNQATIVTMTKQQVPAIDTDKVLALVTQKKTQYDAAITADRAEGAALGVNGTPSIIIGTKLLSALSPADFSTQLTAEINAELSK